MILSNSGVYEICADSEQGAIHQRNRTAYLGEHPARLGQYVTDTNERRWKTVQKQDEVGLLWVEVAPPVQGRLF